MRRLILAAALSFSAAAHAALIPEHLREMPVLGVLFVPAAAAAVVAAALVVLRPESDLVLRASAALLGALLLAYIPFVTLHVPLIDGTPEPLEAVALWTKAVELLGFVTAVALARRRAEPSRLGLLAAAVLVGAAAGAALPTTVLAAGLPRFVVIGSNTFAPHDVSAVAGDEIVWRNGDFRSHTVTADDGSFDSGPIAPGGRYELALPLGSYRYHCTIHRFMRGVVSVFPLVFSGPASIVFGGTATFRGVAPDGDPVTIEAQQQDGSWKQLAEAAPAADGAFAITLPAAFMTLRARSRELVSPTVVVRIRPRLILTLGRKSRSLTVRAEPDQHGALVRLERYDRLLFDWVPVETRRLSASSTASFAYKPARQDDLRVNLTRPVRGFARATSAPLAVRAGSR